LGTPGPVKAQAHARESKQKVLAFFDNKVKVNTNHVHRGETNYINFVIKALCIRG
jgi:hypothetical protein